MKGYMYILECADGSYYTGSTNNLERRLQQHQNGEGANYTKKHLPVKLVYFEEFQRIDDAFYREKQVQGWGRKKKEALINGCFDKLSSLSKYYTQYPKKESVISTGSITDKKTSSITDENDAVSELAKNTTQGTNEVSEPAKNTTQGTNEVSEPAKNTTQGTNEVSELVEDTAKTEQP
jgi:putative endonuclease